MIFARINLRAGLTIVCLGALAACSGAASESSSDSLPYSQFRSMVDQSIAQAKETASPAQIAILERAKIADELTYGDVQEAVRNTFACMEQVDVQGSFLPPDTSQGYPTVAYKYGTDVTRPESEWLPVAEECIKRESTIVEWLYQNQPSVEGLKGRYYTDVIKPRVIACLVAHGVEIPDLANKADLDQLSNDLWMETSHMLVTKTETGEEYTATTPDEAVDCNLESLADN